MRSQELGQECYRSAMRRVGLDGPWLHRYLRGTGRRGDQMDLRATQACHRLHLPGGGQEHLLLLSLLYHPVANSPASNISTWALFPDSVLLIATSPKSYSQTVVYCLGAVLATLHYPCTFASNPCSTMLCRSREPQKSSGETSH